MINWDFFFWKFSDRYFFLKKKVLLEIFFFFEDTEDGTFILNYTVLCSLDIFLNSINIKLLLADGKGNINSSEIEISIDALKYNSFWTMTLN